MRALLTLVALVPMTRVASAQPVDPYAPSAPPAAPAPAAPMKPAAPTAPAAPAPATAPPDRGENAPQDPYAAPPSPDPVLAERVAEALVTRAQQLLDGRVFLDAKQLAVEALVKSPHGAAAERARVIIRAANQGLGLPEDAPRMEPPAPAPAAPAARPAEDVDTSPIQDPTLSAPPVAAPAEGRPRSTRIAATVHGGLYAGLLGATLGSLFSSDNPAAGAVPIGIAAGAAGALTAPMLVDRLGWTEAQIRTVGTATVWGGVIGGLFGDISDLDHTTARQALVGATIGATVAGLGGYAVAHDNRLTRGDVALIDTLAGIGGAGGLTLGMLMQPARTEAYSLNAVLGIAGGVITGYVAAPLTNTTPRRMLRVAGLAAAGGAAPFLLYAAINSPTTAADERITGLLSTGGLIAGAWLGFYLTRGMDEGLDTPDGKRKEPDDAPVALVGRSSSGRWGLGGLGIAPLSPRLSPQPGLALQLVGATF
ncbi:MAG TPA: hypothetical protein VHW23_38945 [Kofleriaceae bacterium]|nr:hypothetical protein [Kofleriaceae bacterium]